jgi:hypothetical protein
MVNRLRVLYPKFYVYFVRVWLKHAERWAVCKLSGTVCLGNHTNNRVESAHRWLKRELCARDSLLDCCKKIWLFSHHMLVDYACKVAASRINRPVLPFNCPVTCLVTVLSRYAAELLLSNWQFSDSISLVDTLDDNANALERINERWLCYTVNVESCTCTCMFNQFYSIPCRHLVHYFLRAKLPLRMLRNSYKSCLS